ncbi:MAG: hypothetical protein HOK35_18165 [Cytophagia bacterium]|nr:hypothetical protein [Cytophagia bacterium]
MIASDISSSYMEIHIDKNYSLVFEDHINMLSAINNIMDLRSKSSNNSGNWHIIKHDYYKSKFINTIFGPPSTDMMLIVPLPDYSICHPIVKPQSIIYNINQINAVMVVNVLNHRKMSFVGDLVKNLDKTDIDRHSPQNIETLISFEDHNIEEIIQEAAKRKYKNRIKLYLKKYPDIIEWFGVSDESELWFLPFYHDLLGVDLPEIELSGDEVKMKEVEDLITEFDKALNDENWYPLSTEQIDFTNTNIDFLSKAITQYRKIDKNELLKRYDAQLSIGEGKTVLQNLDIRLESIEKILLSSSNKAKTSGNIKINLLHEEAIQKIDRLEIPTDTYLKMDWTKEEYYSKENNFPLKIKKTAIFKIMDRLIKTYPRRLTFYQVNDLLYKIDNKLTNTYFRTLKRDIKKRFGNKILLDNYYIEKKLVSALSLNPAIVIVSIN